LEKLQINFVTGKIEFGLLRLIEMHCPPAYRQLEGYEKYIQNGMRNTLGKAQQQGMLGGHNTDDCSSVLNPGADT
jgi:hypothetical protein